MKRGCCSGGNGTEQSNRSTVQPERGASALDLMIVFAVTAVCVTLGGPLFSDFTIRGRVFEALLMADKIKTAIGFTCAVDPTLDSLTSNVIGYRPQESDYVEAVQLGGLHTPHDNHRHG